MADENLKYSLRVIFTDRSEEPGLIRDLTKEQYEEKLESLRKNGYELTEINVYKCHRLMGATTMLHVWQASQQKQDP